MFEIKFSLSTQTKPNPMKSKLLHIPLLALLFSYLFTERSVGINLIAFHSAALAFIVYHKPDRQWSRHQILLFSSSVLLLLFSFLHYSTWAMVWSWIALGTTAVIFQSNEVRQIALSTLSAFISAFITPVQFISRITKRVFQGTPRRASAVLYVIPVLAIGVFSLLYAQANPDIDKAFRLVTGHFFESIAQFFSNFFSPFFWMTLLGVVIGSILLFGKFASAYRHTNQIENDDLKRKRNPYPGSVDVLKTYYKSAVYTVGSLIVVLTGFLFFEIRDVWINFEWNGGELKYFVHSGTYILIFSIIISAFVILVFFNNRLNFYPDNKLRRLSYVWLILNGVLAASVIVRTMHYIDNFALAYLRIGVIFFILACFAGLYSIYLKIKQRKSFNYLLHFNSISVLVVVLVISSVNWDRVITQYNFNHSKKAFVHLRYLSEMSDKTLPLLVRNADELEELKTTQEQLSHLDTRSSYYITKEDYQLRIEQRIERFNQKWESKSFWEWNLPEYLAYHELNRK